MLNQIYIHSVDTSNESKSQEVLGKLKDIEVEARKAFEIKDETNKIKSQEAEAKFKIAIYSQRFGDFETTFKGTEEMLERFKEELRRVRHISFFM